MNNVGATRFNTVTKFYMLPTQYIYVFYMLLRTNSYCFSADTEYVYCSVRSEYLNMLDFKLVFTGLTVFYSRVPRRLIHFRLLVNQSTVLQQTVCRDKGPNSITKPSVPAVAWCSIIVCFLCILANIVRTFILWDPFGALLTQKRNSVRDANRNERNAAKRCI